jgi:GT2 family glycosyltransferase
VSAHLQSRLIVFSEALGELLAAAGLPARERPLEGRPYRCALPGPLSELSAVRVPIARSAAPGAGLRLRLQLGSEVRVAELTASALAGAGAATFTFAPLPIQASGLAQLELTSLAGSGQRAPALLLSPAGRPALLVGHGPSGAVARARRPPLLSRDNWLAAARLLRREGPASLAARILRRLTRPPAPPPPSLRDRYPEWLARHATPGAEQVAEWRALALAAGEPRFLVLLLPGAGATSHSASDGRMEANAGEMRASAGAMVASAGAMGPSAGVMGPSAGAMGAGAGEMGARAAAASRASIEAQLWPAAQVLDAADPLWAQARADYLVPLRAGDLLPPHALLRYAAAAGGRPALITADEDALLPDGSRGAPFFKPGLSPSRLRCEDYVAGAAAFRLEPRFDLQLPLRSWEAVLWDSALRRAEAGPVERIEDVLYSRAGPRPAAPDEEARLLLLEAAARAGWQGAEPRPGRAPGTWRIAPPLRASPLVSVIIPLRDQPEVLDRAIRSIRAKSTYQSLELILVDNGSVEPATRALLERLASEGARVLPQPGPFNFARLNNAAARLAHGDYLLFLNNDVEVLAPSWIEALLEQALRPEVGAAGARLLFPEGPVQHAGVVLGLGGIAGHAGRLLPPSSGGHQRSFEVVHDYSAVTAACLLMRRALFEEVGGFDERLGVSFNDVDLCLRLRQRGLLIVYTPFAELLHHESLTRGPRVDEGEIRLMRERWGALLQRDPYYNRNLSLQRDDFEVQP